MESILVQNGYISEKELEEVLGEQNQRLGELLVTSGVVTDSQLKQALEYQRKSNDRLGRILVDQGIISENEINRALIKLDRRLGEILRDRGLLSDWVLYWILQTQPKAFIRKYKRII